MSPLPGDDLLPGDELLPGDVPASVDMLVPVDEVGLTERARAMLETLPPYYYDEPLVQRVLLAWANEFDRLAAARAALAVQLKPGTSSDEFGTMALWEDTLRLPVMPPDATAGQRLATIIATLRATDAGSSADYLDVLATATGNANFRLLRNTPENLADTLELPFLPGSYNAGQVVAIARKRHPAHRGLFLRFTDGFLLDVSQLDAALL